MATRVNQIHLKRSKKTRSVTLSESWLRKHIKASQEDEVYAFPVPGTEAVVLMRLDPFNPIPDNIRDLLLPREGEQGGENKALELPPEAE